MADRFDRQLRRVGYASGVTFRGLTVADIPELFQVRIATWHNANGEEELASLGITLESVRDLIESGSHRGWLCEADGRVIGFAMGNRENGEMWVIAVLREFEGRGIGRALLQRVEDWLASESWNEIWLTTDPDESMRAVGFYRHLGWADWKLDGDRYMRKTVGRQSGAGSA